MIIGSGCISRSKVTAPGPNGATSAFNPAQKAATVTLSNADRTATITGANITGRVYTLAGKLTGKFYAEFLCVSYAGGANTSPRFGVAPAGASLTTSIGANATEWGFSKRSDGVGIVTSNSVTIVTGYELIVNGSIVGIAVDLDASKIWFSKNNVWQGSGANPATGANPTATITAATIYFPVVSYNTSGTQTGVINSPAVQTYAPPAGFNAWS